MAHPQYARSTADHAVVISAIATTRAVSGLIVTAEETLERDENVNPSVSMRSRYGSSVADSVRTWPAIRAVRKYDVAPLHITRQLV